MTANLQVTVPSSRHRSMPDFSKPKLLWTLPFEGAWPMSLTFAGDDRIVAGNRDGSLFVWNLPVEPPAESDAAPVKGEGHPLWPSRQLTGHSNCVSHVVALRDGSQVVSASYDHSVRIWSLDGEVKEKGEAVLDIDQRKAEAKKKRNDEPLNRPGVEVEVQAESTVLEGHKDWVMSLGISGDEKRIVSGDGNSHVLVRELESGKTIAKWQGHPWAWAVSAALSADGKTALVSEYRSSRDDFDRPAPAFRLWDVETQKSKLDLLQIQFPKMKAEEHSYGSSQVWRKFVARGLLGATFSPDGRLVAAGQSGETGTGQVHLFKTDDGKLLKTIGGHRYGVTDVKFTADAGHVVSVGRDTNVRITKIDDGKEVAVLGNSRGGQFKDWLSAVALSPNEKYLAATDIAGKVHVWSLS